LFDEDCYCSYSTSAYKQSEGNNKVLVADIAH